MNDYHRILFTKINPLFVNSSQILLLSVRSFPCCEIQGETVAANGEFTSIHVCASTPVSPCKSHNRAMHLHGVACSPNFITQSNFLISPLALSASVTNGKRRVYPVEISQLRRNCISRSPGVGTWALNDDFEIAWSVLPLLFRSRAFDASRRSTNLESLLSPLSVRVN